MNIPEIGFVFSRPDTGCIFIILSLQNVYTKSAFVLIGFVFSTSFQDLEYNTGTFSVSSVPSVAEELALIGFVLASPKPGYILIILSIASVYV